MKVLADRPGLRLPYHRGTSAHVASVYPFSVQAPMAAPGMSVGLDLLAGGAEFRWDPYDAYAAGYVTNPNAWVLGEPGNGKSALVKCILWRMAGLYGGEARRWVAVVDPKGEYTALAQRLGLAQIRLTPGGTVRVNPLAPGPAAQHESSDRQSLRRADLVGALVATVLKRPLNELEDAALFAAVEDVIAARDGEPTLKEVAALLANPTDSMRERLRLDRDELLGRLAPIAYSVDKMLTRSLRGMFDGPSTVPLRWDGPGLAIDLSAIPLESEALPLVMVATAGWLQQLMACPGPRRLQVLDEAWALLAARHTAGYLQSCFKLGRTYGTANVCVTHRVSDLAAQADDGSSTAKIAAGLLADSATHVLLRQAPDQVEAATEHFGLTATEASILTNLARGRGLWKIGGRTAVVQHLIAPAEEALCDTDARMAGNDGRYRS